MILVLLVCGLVLIALVLLGLFVFGLRRRLIQRSGGTFDCSLRWHAPEPEDSAGVSGKGWGYGVARDYPEIPYAGVVNVGLEAQRLVDPNQARFVTEELAHGDRALAILGELGPVFGDRRVVVDPAT